METSNRGWDLISTLSLPEGSFKNPMLALETAPLLVVKFITTGLYSYVPATVFTGTPPCVESVYVGTLTARAVESDPSLWMGKSEVRMVVYPSCLMVVLPTPVATSNEVLKVESTNASSLLWISVFSWDVV